MEGVLILAALGGGTVAVFIALRFWIVLHHRVVPRESLSLLVVAGSGGHTTEILRLLGNLSNAYSPRHYIFADTDEMSAHKIRAFEVDRAERYSSTMYTTHRIPRSREVRQSWLSTVLTTFYSMLHSFPLTFRLKPDLIPKAVGEEQHKSCRGVLTEHQALCRAPLRQPGRPPRYTEAN
ncbi:UDP-N-acetylglucosamine transferase subunit ALG14 homolog isoform X2 [Loxodonta africana]|uniref:UDP-N-acetylglucosamine transferase subunit ALG14 homolog isoform X2 n=1 Tax=Loxodonta africana TaxID=9785 RepID=UPI000C813B4C|nr:UDP-N-acetylglucosamine transferase subunit ALG14 homolog isoform X2 [Loxodonta africana]XP_049735689.1 UDP-N-acetylglucosamine transferase subunit ALG14 homolog isoform X3 [Elephas maximus indicus]